MDPLSITAGILAVLGASGEVAKQVKNLLALEDAPDELLALNIEISDLRFVLHDVEYLLQRQSEESAAHILLGLTKALQRSRETVLALEKLIAYDLTVINPISKKPRIDRSRWLRSVKHLETYKDRVRRSRLEISAASAIMAASLGVDLSRKMQQLSVSIEGLSIQYSDTSKTLIKHMKALKGLNNDSPIATSTYSQCRQVTSDFVKQDDAYLYSTPNGKLVNTPMIENALEHTTMGMNETKQSATQPRDASFEVAACSCGLRCKCICHEQSPLRSPGWMSPFFGSLFVSPKSVRTCNSRSCQARMIRLSYTYAFPLWFLDRVFSASITRSTSKGPELLIRIMRIRDPLTAFFTISSDGPFQDNTTKAVKALLDDGKASVFDVTPSGMTALHLALLKHDWTLAELLVRLGSDIFYVDAYGRSPYSIAWRSILSNGELDETRTKLQDLFSPSHLAELKLPELHKALMGLSGRTFHAAVDLTGRSAIDAVDASRRTALSWAAPRGDVHALSRLLVCGADPNVADLSGKTPLHWSALGGEARCVESLIVAKADIEARDMSGMTALCHAATGSDGGEALKVLLASGANVQSLDNDGWSALDWAAWFDAPEKLKVLLDHKTKFQISLDHNAVYWTMNHNCHGTLTLLLRHPSFQATAKADGYSILDGAARWADFKMLCMLFEDIETLCIELGAHEMTTLLRYGRWRRDHNQEWSEEEGKHPDEDPDAWYNVFEAIVDGSCERGHTERFLNTHDLSIDNNDDTDADDSWEEAHERLT